MESTERAVAGGYLEEDVVRMQMELMSLKEAK
jgi:hypothetical protein